MEPPFARPKGPGAIIEGDYRYKLWREFSPMEPGAKSRGTIIWMMLNPSTADATADDNTIKKCVHYSSFWGFSRLEVYNLFAVRATDPKVMKKHADPVGPRNDTFLKQAIASSHPIVVAWGNHGLHLDRQAAVSKLIGDREVRCFGKNKNGTPKHPLLLSWWDYIYNRMEPWKL